MNLSEEQIEKLREKVEYLLLSVPYQFAKTMPENPHYYTLRRNWKNYKPFFENVVQFMRDFGVKEEFGGRTYTYYYLDGHKYWTMGAPLEKTILINRAKIDDKANQTS